MQKIQNGTSELILSNFEYSLNENSANNFWALGYLVVFGIRPYSKEMIEQFIRMSRRQHQFSSTIPNGVLRKK
jgi:hypothetical protein